MTTGSSQAGGEREAFVQWLSTTYPTSYDVADAEHFWRHNHVSALSWQAGRAALSAPPAEVALSQACNLLSTSIGVLMGCREKIGYVDRSPIAQHVAEAVKFLEPWPQKMPTALATPATAVAQPMMKREDLLDYAQTFGAVLSDESGLVSFEPFELERFVSALAASPSCEQSADAQREKAHEGPLVGDQIPVDQHAAQTERQSWWTGSIVGDGKEGCPPPPPKKSAFLQKADARWEENGRLLGRAISVFGDVLGDIGDWEDKALAEAVEEARNGLLRVSMTDKPSNICADAALSATPTPEAAVQQGEVPKKPTLDRKINARGLLERLLEKTYENGFEDGRAALQSAPPQAGGNGGAV